MNDPKGIVYSVVVPIYNEEENLSELTQRLVSVLDVYGRYEIIYVDDGSYDRSSELIAKYCAKNTSVKCISFSRNFGHQAAISAGLAYAVGDVVAVMDGDMQDPPEVLPEFFQKWQEGFQVVYAIREKRKEGWLKRSTYFVYYRLLSALAEIEIPLDSGDFSVMDRAVVEKLNALPERNRFIRGIRAWVGYRQIGIAYERRARFAGKSKYTFKTLLKLGYDGILSFSKQPLILATRIGLLVTTSTFLFIGVTLWRKLFTDIEPQGWTSIMIVVLFMGGIQLLMLGILGEYIGRIFDESKGRPTYIVSETKNI